MIVNLPVLKDIETFNIFILYACTLQKDYIEQQNT